MALGVSTGGINVEKVDLMIVESYSNINDTAILIAFDIRDVIIKMGVEKNSDTFCS